MAKKKILMEKKWLSLLSDEFTQKYMQNLQAFLNEEKTKGYEIYPPSEYIFNAFCQTPFNKVNVVIMGQDPYHGYNQAHGLSFSVKKDVQIPPSLRNIYKELENDLKNSIPKTGYLIPWARQGVLLLNATLTVRANQPRSHYGKGWEIFTDKVIKLLAEKKDPIVFMLWGKSAFEKCQKVLNNIKHPHLVLSAAHPSPYSVTKFFGCKHFSKCNEFLIKNNKKPIDWKI